LRRPLHPLLAACTAGTAALALALGTASAPALAAAGGPSYQQDDYSRGQVYSILPPGEHGLYSATDLAAFETTQARPTGASDQKTKYDALLYGAPKLTDATLSSYYNPETFGIKPGELTRTERPDTAVPVTIYRDKSDVPHIYGDTDEATEFGAGYAGAEDRLFLMDVLRHYGRGTTSSFLGPSCSDERMDHDQLLLTGYSDAELQAQFDNLSTQYGAQGTRFQKLFTSYVAGINAYVAATATDPSLLPGDYAVVGSPPQPWTIKDIIAIAGLVGGIFGKGGGGELANAKLLQYLTKEIGAAQAAQALKSLRGRNDPLAPTTTTKPFPYDIPGKTDPRTTALPDDASAPLTGGPTDTTPGCELTAPNVPALTIISSAIQFPKMLSNALVVDAKHSAGGHPLAVFGPQVGYFTPQILMEQELHGPDLVAMGASFAGTNGIVELGRGEDYAWSATSAGTDNTDTRLERLCSPTGGAVAAEEKSYLFKGRCLPMKHHTFTQTAVPKPGGPGAPVVLTHELYYTVHGPVQGWTTSGGKPVAVSSQRSTYGHELDSGIGFLAWNTPSLTHDAASWMKGAGEIGYTFNWFYVDDKDIAYFCSGANPVRPKDVDPDLPTWGDGTAEWRGMEPFAEHPHEVNPAKGYFTSWNNKPAPQFSAADSQYSYNGVYRSQSLDEALTGQLAKHKGKLTRADLTQAMSTASTVDLSGRRVLPELLPYLAKVPLDAKSQQLVTRLRAWLATGAHRIKASAAATEYRDADAVAIMDELYPRLIRAIYDPLFAQGGLDDQDGLTFSYKVVPQRFADTPNARGSHLGSAYDGGWEGYLLTTLRQLRGVKVADGFGPAVTSRICSGGCPAAIAKAFKDTAAALTTANGTATVTSWTLSTATKAAGTTMPLYDAIHYSAVGVAGQPVSDWQNRPTFQQVAMFSAHRPGLVVAGPTPRRAAPPTTARSALPATGASGLLAGTGLALLVLLLVGRRRWRSA
jgi:acyl-homoserine lactone acylase PvdQ